MLTRHCWNLAARCGAAGGGRSPSCWMFWASQESVSHASRSYQEKDALDSMVWNTVKNASSLALSCRETAGGTARGIPDIICRGCVAG